MKKKVISALLASTMIVSLVACGSTGGDSSDASSKGSGTTATSTAGGDDAATAESGSGSGDSAASADWIESSTLEDDAVPGENDDRAFEKFDHVVEVHYGYQIDPKDTTLPDGDSVDNNQYTRYLLDNYNIKVVCDWTAGNTADFQQKVSLAIASASLPDAVIAPTRNYLVQAARAKGTRQRTRLEYHHRAERRAGANPQEILCRRHGNQYRGRRCGNDAGNRPRGASGSLLRI